MRQLITVALCIVLVGCQAPPPVDVEPPPSSVGMTAVNPIRRTVRIGGDQTAASDGLQWLDAETITLQFTGRLDELVIVLQRFEISLVIEPDKRDTIVQVSAKNRDARSVLLGIAAHLGASTIIVSRGARVVYVGEPTPADQEVRVYHVPAADVSQWAEALSQIREGVTVNRAGDAVVAYGPRGSLAIVDDAIAALSGLRGQWAIDVRFVEVSESAAQQIGLDWELTGKVALGAAAATTGNMTSALAAVDLVGMLEAMSTTDGVRILTTARLHVVEGDEAELQLGETTPVARRSISDQGTSTVQGFEGIDTGVLLKVRVRTAPGGLLRVDAEPEVSQITGFIDNAPIRSRRRVKSSAVVEPGGVVVLGGLRDIRETTGFSGLPGFSIGKASKTSSDRRLFVVLTVSEPS